MITTTNHRLTIYQNSHPHSGRMGHLLGHHYSRMIRLPSWGVLLLLPVEVAGELP